VKALFALILLAAAPPMDRPHTYLASVVGIPRKPNEQVESFSFSTWGVRFQAVCRIPSGWRINAGSSATPNGVLEGNGSQGATWFSRGSPRALRGLVLLTLSGPIQPRDIRFGNGVVPATFNGRATLSTDAGERKVALTYRNLRLVPARRCPSS
jgi:hypothetical protein